MKETRKYSWHSPTGVLLCNSREARHFSCEAEPFSTGVFYSACSELFGCNAMLFDNRHFVRLIRHFREVTATHSVRPGVSLHRQIRDSSPNPHSVAEVLLCRTMYC